jgi:hypothetical protein
MKKPFENIEKFFLSIPLFHPESLKLKEHFLQQPNNRMQVLTPASMNATRGPLRVIPRGRGTR